MLQIEENHQDGEEVRSTSTQLNKWVKLMANPYVLLICPFEEEHKRISLRLPVQ